MAKIVILNGSPRRNGNSAALVKKFTEGAQRAGNTVTEFYLAGMNIKGCKGCFGGDSARERRSWNRLTNSENPFDKGAML